MKKLVQYCMVAFMFASCKNDIEVIRTLTSINELPDITGEDIEIIYTDSMTIRMKLTAPKLIRFDNVKEPYYEFPEGIHVFNYDNKKKLVSDIEAGYAIYYEVKRLWHVKKNVIGRNFEKNEQINTEELFWDEGKGLIYTDKFVRITNSSGIFFGEKGFESDQNMNHWKLIGSSGTLNVKEKK